MATATQNTVDNRAAVLTEAWSSLLTPTTLNTAQIIQSVVREQQLLNLQVWELTEKLRDAANNTTSQQREVEQYAARLKATKARCDTLNRQLLVIKNRLIKVHERMRARTAALKKDNDLLREELTEEGRVVNQGAHQQVGASNTRGSNAVLSNSSPKSSEREITDTTTSPVKEPLSSEVGATESADAPTSVQNHLAQEEIAMAPATVETATENGESNIAERNAVDMAPANTKSNKEEDATEASEVHVDPTVETIGTVEEKPPVAFQAANLEEAPLEDENTNVAPMDENTDQQVGPTDLSNAAESPNEEPSASLAIEQDDPAVPAETPTEEPSLDKPDDNGAEMERNEVAQKPKPKGKQGKKGGNK